MNNNAQEQVLTTAIRLAEAQIGQAIMIRHLEGGRSFLARLAALGFTPGTPLTIVRKSDHGPTLIEMRGIQIALGYEETHKIFVSPMTDELLSPEIPILPQKYPVIALAGQPNVGKSTVFNLLTGLSQHVGNWTGKTVEQKSGNFSFQGKTFSLIDLPGTYSLTASSEEERIARDFIIKERPDLVIAVVDAATLEHNLFLVAELLLLPVPVILALNMMDVAQQEGIQVEPKVLESALGIPVVPMAASRGQGIVELQKAILRLINHEAPYEPKYPSILPAHQSILEKLKVMIANYVHAEYPVDWVALKLLEGDEELTQMMKTAMPPELWETVRMLLYQHEDAILDIAGARYEWIGRMIRVAVVKPQISRVGLTPRLDRVLTHPIYGTIMLVGLLGMIFGLTYSIGTPIQTWLAGGVSALADWIRVSLSAWPKWMVEMISGGVLGGVGLVFTFLPILMIFYAILGLMEDTGYLARAAYLTDRWMHMMGLHGKSFLPILLGFGCNVPAVLGTRIIESKRSRLLTAVLIPLIPCTARMTVVTILAPLFFGSSATWVAWGLVAGNLLLLAGIGMAFHHFFFEDEHVPFIMELPLYHLPNPRTIGLYVWQNILSFVQKAGTTILVASLVIWTVSYFPTGNMMTSFLAKFGVLLDPIGRWMGLPWPMLVAILTSVVAKENTIATLGILYGNISTVLPTLLTVPAALALLVFQMLFIPCVGTIAALWQETRSLRWTAASVLMMLALSLGLAAAVYQIGRVF
jgi:ferrous iron transport protein B